MADDKGLSIVRTYVQLAIGALLGWLLTEYAVELDSAHVEQLVMPIVTAVYYLAARELTERHPSLGFILGPGTPPTYTPEA